jgi:predicted DNA-binding antitoxin AbrB/MazE fold protein
MMTNRAVFRGGVLRPIEPLSLPEGVAVDVTLIPLPPALSPIEEEVIKRLQASTSFSDWLAATELLPSADDDDYDIEEALKQNRIWSGETH